MGGRPEGRVIGAGRARIVREVGEVGEGELPGAGCGAELVVTGGVEVVGVGIGTADCSGVGSAATMSGGAMLACAFSSLAFSTFTASVICGSSVSMLEVD